MEEVKLIEIKKEILSDNKGLADEIRSRLKGERTYMLNLMSSPGSGKTSLILKMIEVLKNELRMCVIEADVDSTVDSEKVAARGVNAIQLRTGGFCHVDAAMVEKGLESLDLGALDLIVLENVGNLICPAESDTGAVKNVMILSVPEGDDKPLKYPLMFTTCDALIVNKIDYLKQSDFDMEALRDRVLTLNRQIRVFELSCKTGQGIDSWCSWLRDEVTSFVSR